MDSHFLQRKQQLIIKPPPHINLLQQNNQRQINPNFIFNHLSPPASKITLPSNGLKLPIEYHKQRANHDEQSRKSNNLSFPYCQQNKALMRQFIENSSQLNDNKLNRSKSQKYTANIPHYNKMVFEGGRPKGITSFNSPYLANNQSESRLFQPLLSPKKIQKIQTIRRVSQHKHKIASKNNQFNTEALKNDNGQLNKPNQFIQKVVTCSNQNQANFMKSQLQQSQQKLQSKQKMLDNEKGVLNFQGSNHFYKQSIYSKNGFTLNQPRDKEKQELQKIPQLPKKSITCIEQQILMNTRRLIEEIFQNQTCKALLQMNSEKIH